MNNKIDNLTILDPNDLRFSREESGFLALSCSHGEYHEVSIIRLLPFYEEQQFVSVAFRDKDKEWKEIGLIKDTSALPEDMREIVLDYLSYRYFIPEITKIYTISDNRMGYLFLDAMTTAGRKKISVGDWWTNFRLRENGYLTVTDADGNRYIITDMSKMDKPSMKKLQLFI